MTTALPLSLRSRAALLALSLGAILAMPADAAVYGGNPALTLSVDRPEADMTGGDVTIDTVRLHLCGGGVASWRPQVTIDPVAGWTMAIPAGDLCSVDFVWADSMVLDGDGYTIEYQETITTVQLSGATQSTDLTPFLVLDGAVYGGNPALTVSIQ